MTSDTYLAVDDCWDESKLLLGKKDLPSPHSVALKIWL